MLSLLHFSACWPRFQMPLLSVRPVNVLFLSMCYDVIQRALGVKLFLLKCTVFHLNNLYWLVHSLVYMPFFVPYNSFNFTDDMLIYVSCQVSGSTSSCNKIKPFISGLFSLISVFPSGCWLTFAWWMISELEFIIVLWDAPVLCLFMSWENQLVLA